MKHIRSLIFVLFFCLFQLNSFAQGVQFLQVNPSPSLSAMGATGAALPTNDPFGFLWNPAQLGYNSLHNNLSFIFYPTPVDWIPAFNLDIELNALAFNAGYNFKNIIGFPLSFGFAYSNPEINFGEYIVRDEQGQPIGSFESKDYYNAYSFGFGMEYFVQLGFGYTIKNVTSNLAVGPIGEQEIMGTAETSVNDFGILLNVPVIKLIDKNLLLPLDEGLNCKPTFDFSLGYSKSNIGDEIEYNTFPGQADPLPRLDRTGYGLSAGFDLISKNLSLNLFTISFTSEAEDILVTSDENGNWEYQSTWSDLNFWKNVVMIEGDEDIVSRTGTKLEFVESFAYYFGHFSGCGYPDPRETNGIEIRAKGLFKLWALWAKEPITDFFRDHFDIIYYNTNYFANHPFETNMTGLAFYVHNLNELFE
jgi:hypothetical protein